mgnify:CR=1 FL=1
MWSAETLLFCAPQLGVNIMCPAARQQVVPPAVLLQPWDSTCMPCAKQLVRKYGTWVPCAKQLANEYGKASLSLMCEIVQITHPQLHHVCGCCFACCSPRDEYLATGVLHMTNAVSFLNNSCNMVSLQISMAPTYQHSSSSAVVCSQPQGQDCAAAISSCVTCCQQLRHPHLAANQSSSNRPAAVWLAALEQQQQQQLYGCSSVSCSPA